MVEYGQSGKLLSFLVKFRTVMMSCYADLNWAPIRPLTSSRAIQVQRNLRGGGRLWGGGKKDKGEKMGCRPVQLINRCLYAAAM